MREEKKTEEQMICREDRTGQERRNHREYGTIVSFTALGIPPHVAFALPSPPPIPSSLHFPFPPFIFFSKAGAFG